MIFIALLIASAVAIAGSAAFFSVYGLANTFSGVFWSVVIMGASLEAGKLVAASYLYRYWRRTNILLKSYLIAGIVALMVLTSGGIFGYLSSGYQTDVLPLRQLQTQITLLEDEKSRMLDRKKEIDKQITQMPENFVTSRIRLMREFQEEQKSVTNRIKQLDVEILDLKKQQIKTEAHIGPITYIAKAFDLDTDYATKYLVLLIIFAFDPMAVALTLAVNIALRQREEERAQKQSELQSEPEIQEKIVYVDKPVEVIKEVPKEVEKIVYKEVPKEVEKIVYVDKPVEVIKEVPKEVEKIVYVDKPVEVIKEVPKEVEKTAQIDPKAPELEAQLQQRIRAYPELWRTYVESTSVQDKIEQLLQHYKYLTEKKKAGKTLSKDEQWEMGAIEEILKRKGFDVYLK